jgi:hypothetical protein
MINPMVQRGEFLVGIGDNATTLCPEHAQDFAVTAMLLEQPVAVYELDPEEEYIACQTCFMLHQACPGEKSGH